MRYKGVRTIPRWPAAALVTAFCVAIVGAQWALMASSGPAPHAAHALSASLDSDFAVIAEHPHAEDRATPVKSETVARGVLPRATTALAALGLVAAMAIVATLWQRTAITVIRGPPRAVANVIAGQVLLTRLCIARR